MKKNIYTGYACSATQHVLVITLVVFVLFGISFAENNLKTNTDFNLLKNRLVKDGFAVETIDKVYGNTSISFEIKGVSLFFVHSESRLNYDQFLSGKSIAKAAKYMKEHASDLEKAQILYGVDKTIVTAITLVETRLGTYLGKRLVINTLSTMAALSESGKRERLWKSLPDDRRMKREKFNTKADKKSAWAYEELKALLKFAAREGIDPVSIKGSYAGAMGISQFMPSNALNLAKDGNQDGKVNLFTHADAIHSIANYLKHYGWEPSVNRQKAHKILYEYNHSNYYVDTLLKISDRLKD